ncbi:MAG: ThiF family adenylyltransferase [Candidatus Anstonellales archaeon]
MKDKLNRQIAIVGIGGLGSFVSELLAREKLKLLLIDFDIIKKKNINQRFCKPSYIGMKKVEAAEKELKGLTKIAYIPFDVSQAKFDASLILDCTDSLQSRKKVLKKAEEIKCPYVFCSISGNIGMTTIVEVSHFHKFSSIFFKKKQKQERSNAYTAAFLASIACANVMRYLKNNAAIIFPEIIISNIDKYHVEVNKLDEY